MIPAFDHCPDCGSKPVQVASVAWGALLETKQYAARVYWWCRECRRFLL